MKTVICIFGEICEQFHFSGATNIAETQMPKDHQYLRIAHKLILVKTDEGDLPGREKIDLIEFSSTLT